MLNPDRRRRLPKIAGTVLVLSALAAPEDPVPRTTTFRSSIPELQPLWRLVRATLGRNRVAFPGKTGRVEGFSAGSLYPQVWIRDLATILPAAKYYDSRDSLVSGLEEILSFQGPDGGLPDWVDVRRSIDKNTTETDQEASMVLAAEQAVRIIGPEWLGKKIDGRTILDRLDSALAFVLNNRFEAGRGLIKGAHTADWGDVGLEDSDRTAVYVDADTHWTCDIYDQSMFYGAARALAGLLQGEGRTVRAGFWMGRAEDVRSAADRLLWQEDRGFYRVHIHLDSLRHGFDEDEMFALGGNTEAILSGLAGETKAARIIRTALDRQSSFRMPTIGAVLLPPYPRGTFKHPMVDDPYEYQNGGLWDWFAGKLIRAMFDRGFSAEARAALIAIARKNLAAGGLHEWNAPDGSGRGSSAFTGSAGSLALAAAEGYFGIRLTRNSCNLEPRLGKDGAKVFFRLPAADVSVAYESAWDPERGRLTFRFESSVRRPGRLRLLLPEPPGKAGLVVLLDGRAAPFEVERIREETLLVLETDFSPHVLTVRGFNFSQRKSNP
ncbi:MAG: hypothetical protein JW843_10695 [Candidatus Aminicenantes bacterium]|nr:hypothetical protein [Candidatus Aminicenantes bacterium]